MSKEKGIVGELLSIERGQKKLVGEALNLISARQNAYHALMSEQAGHILSESSVRKICLKYRLRFLGVKHFKNRVPAEALDKLTAFEGSYGVKLDKLMVIAPGELFELEDEHKDPILLADLGAGKYLFVHKWGGEFERGRNILSYPLRNVVTLFVSVTVAAMILSALLTPFVMGLHMSVIIVGFFAIWMALLGITIYSVFAFRVNPTSLNWNSKFLD